MTRAGLLAAIDTHVPGGPRRWSDVMVLMNRGPAHDPRALAGNVPSNRGFNGVLFSGGRQPSHFLKVRSASYNGFERETRITRRVAEHARCAHLVPEVLTFDAGPVRVLTLAYVRGRDLTQVLNGMDAEGCVAAVSEVLEATRPLWRCAGDILNDASTETAGRDAAYEAAPGAEAEGDWLPNLEADLACLTTLGLAPGVAAALRDRLVRTVLPIIPQHGDFWPRNLLRGPEQWQVLDFETFGTIRQPLYDVLQLLRGCAGPLRSGGGIGWLPRWCEVLEAGGRVVARLRRALAPHLEGLTAEQVDAASARYLVTLTVQQHAKGDPGATRRLLRQMHHLPELLDDGRVGRTFVNTGHEG